jgi:hypothetical protein
MLQYIWRAWRRTKLQQTATSTAPLSKPRSDGMQYYDLQKHWTKKIKPHLSDKKLNDILVRDLNKLSSSQWGKPFVHGMYPCAYGDSQWSHERRGRPPRYWKYVQYRACHWLVNFNLRLATLVEPDRPWRIVTSEKHSTVWDGDRTLFEFNFLAFGIPAQKCFDLAFENGEVLPPGKFRPTYRIPHWTKSVRSRSQPRALASPDHRL